ncbi:hypothetical protein EDD15DRAFT_2177214 [Pisolithus albus]|nr:hypothetical protein EDD15DRAFT_2177214 [Pisolithus albus]
MPRRKTTRGLPKNISCPQCGKRFCTATNVLQHMNQPTSSCYGASLAEEVGLLASANFLEGAIHRETSRPREDAEVSGTHWYYNDEDTDMGPPTADVSVRPDYDVDPTPAVNAYESQREQLSGSRRFIETYEGCAEMFPGGETFMDQFRNDQYAEKRRENIYFPWASRQEWEFASWLLRSRLSMAAIDNLLSLEIIKSVPLSFRSAKELRSRAETLPPGPLWLCETLTTEYPTKEPPLLFYRNPIECLQALLSHPHFESHISFVPRRVWTCAAKICRIYDEWLSGDRAWSMQEALPPGATLLGVVLSSDKTNISVMSGNCMAHPLLISLANIDKHIRSKTSLHAYLLLALLPIAKFAHKNTRVRSLLQDRLVHQALNIVLSPLKTAASVGIMMSDPSGNLPNTLAAIHTACSQSSPTDYTNFLKAIKPLRLNGVVEPFWKLWLLSDPSDFITPEVLHHFHRMFWDHDVKWCIAATGAVELDFRFSIIQTLVGYRAFNEGISKLKQVTGRDHRAIQRYIIAAVAGSVPRKFLMAIRALLDFRYLAQAPSFTMRSIDRVASALQEFHNHKEAIVSQGVRADWKIPKLELLQSVVPSIRQSGAVMQWSADITEHAHVEEIKVPARASNNQNYNSQIVRHLDRLDKCFRFDLATSLEHRVNKEGGDEDSSDLDVDEEHEPDAEKIHPSDYSSPTRRLLNYFSISSSLLLGARPSARKPYCTFATATTAFHLATKPSLRLTVDEAATTYQLPALEGAIATFFANGDTCFQGREHATNKLYIWHKVRVQQLSYHDRNLLPPQTLRAIPPASANPYGRYDPVIVSVHPQSDWPRSGLAGHSVSQLRIIFRLSCSDLFLAYVQHFNIATNVSPATGMHLLKRAVGGNGQRVGEVIPLTRICSPAHLVPNFGRVAHSRLTSLSSYELSNDFWLNKYFSKEFYYALSLT